MRKIAIVGPECSGKTTLARALADHFAAPCVAEHARQYLAALEHAYNEAHLLELAIGQLNDEQDAMDGGAELVICDTDMITMRIWSEEKFGRCDPWIIAQSEERHYDLWMLCSPDIPWESDPLRENPHDRDRLFQAYMAMLDRLNKPYVILSGSREARLKNALRAVARLA